MKKNIVSWAIAAGLLLMAAGVAAAQDSTTTRQTTTTTTTTQNDNSTATQNDTTAANSHSDVRTVTGCLRQGDGASEYEILAQDGSSWEIRSDSVDLASQVGHTITVTGAVNHAPMHDMKEDAKREAAQHGMNTSAEHGHLTVTNVSMVSDHCS